jgi:hypothetical protein
MLKNTTIYYTCKSVAFALILNGGIYSKAEENFNFDRPRVNNTDRNSVQFVKGRLAIFKPSD